MVFNGSVAILEGPPQAALSGAQEIPPLPGMIPEKQPSLAKADHGRSILEGDKLSSSVHGTERSPESGSLDAERAGAEETGKKVQEI